MHLTDIVTYYSADSDDISSGKETVEFKSTQREFNKVICHVLGVDESELIYMVLCK